MIVKSLVALAALLGVAAFAVTQQQDCGSKTGATCSSSQAKAQTVATKDKPACCADDKAATVKTVSTTATTDCPAGKQSCTADKSACNGDKVACSDKSGCDYDALAKAGLKAPAMTFKVGEKTTACPMEAANLAKADGGKIRFVVGDKAFDDEGEAKTAYAAQLDEFLKEVTAVRYAVGDECTSCPLTADSLAKKAGAKVRFRVAAYDFETKEAAEKAATKAREAVEKMHLTMRVGDKTFECPVTAGELAKSEGKQVEYCVGDKATPCKVTASLDLARARIEAAVAALAEAAKG